MKYVVLNPRTFAFIVGTRVALAAGIGLLVSGKLAAARRRVLGTTLVVIGAATTVPAAILVVQGLRQSKRLDTGVDRDKGLIGATRLARKGDDDLM
jgi:hypothetical protein